MDINRFLEDGVEVLEESQDLEELFIESARKYVLEYREDFRECVDCEYVLEVEAEVAEYIVESVNDYNG